MCELEKSCEELIYNGLQVNFSKFSQKDNQHKKAYLVKEPRPSAKDILPQLGLGKITGTEEPNRNRTEIPETGTRLIPSNTRTVPIFLYPK